MQYTVSTNSYGIRIFNHGEYHQILNNIIRYIGNSGATEIGDGIQFTDSGVGSDRVCDTRHVLVEGNTIEYCGHTCLMLRGQENIVRNNTFYNPWEKGTEIEGNYPSATYPEKSYNVLENNIIYGI